MERATARHQNATCVRQHRPPAREPQPPVAAEQRVAVEDHDAMPLFPRQALEPLEQLDLLRSIERLAEAAGLAKSARLAEDERARRPPAQPAGRIPEGDPEARHEAGVAERDGCAAREAAALDRR